MTGCEALSFAPSIVVTADTLQAGAPAGYGVQVHVPQNSDSEGLATPDVRDVELALPLGTVISPAAANGLSACNEQQFDHAWKDEWIADHSAPTTGPVARRDPGQRGARQSGSGPAPAK